MAARRRKGVELSGGVKLLIFLGVVGVFLNQWASGHPLRWALAIGGTLLVVWLVYRFIRWSVRRAKNRSKVKGGKIASGVRSRKRLRFWIGRLNLSGRFLPLPSSVGIDAGPYSVNSRTGKERVNLPWAYWWEGHIFTRDKTKQQKEQAKPRPGDVVRAPQPRWVKTDHFLLNWEGKLELDPMTMEPFPLDVLPDDFRIKHCNGYEVVRHPRPANTKGRRTGYMFILEGRAEFTSWADCWEACHGKSSQQILIDNMQRKTGAGQ